MKEKAIKKEMMRLWKETFHDSDEYICLVFDNYFSIENVTFHEKEGRIVSALLAVPYHIGGFGSSERIEGAYFCGLATEPKFRKMGIMDSLLKEMEYRFHKRNFAFTFLIPADAGLRRYYYKRGYIDSFYHCCYNYIHENNVSCKLSKDIRCYNTFNNKKAIQQMGCNIGYITGRYEDNVNVESRNNNYIFSLNSIYYTLNKYECNNDAMTVIHTKKDFIAIIEESLISGNIIYVCFDENYDICKNVIIGLCFCNIDYIAHKIIVKKVIYDNSIIYSMMLEKINSDFTGFSIYIYEDYNMSSNVGESSSVCYGTGNEILTENVEAYGMIKILNSHEVQKFITSSARDQKYPILMNNPKSTPPQLFINTSMTLMLD